MPKANKKYPYPCIKILDYFDTSRMLELSGIHPTMGIPTSIFPRFPPGISPPSIGMITQKRLKEKFFRDNSSMNFKLDDFMQMYQKFASGLFEIAYPARPPGHPLFSRLDSVASLQNENMKLKKENIDLQKKLTNNKKENKHI